MHCTFVLGCFVIRHSFELGYFVIRHYPYPLPSHVFSFCMSTDSHSSQPALDAQGDDQLWEQVAELVDGLSAAWEKHFQGSAAEPELEVFLPADNQLLRKLALPELVKADLEFRWQNKCHPKKVEAYAEQFPLRDEAGELPIELIHEELQVRMQSGNRVTEEEIHQRFPQQAPKLCELVGGMAMSQTPTQTFFVETAKATQLPTDVVPDPNETVQFTPGQQIDDFQLLTKLGEGAFAQVFLARQVSMERMVALKISSHQGSEPQTLAQLDHANLVRVFDQRQAGDPGVRLLYMEVVPGGTLHSVVDLIRRTAPGARTGKLLLAAVDEKLAAHGSSRPEDSPNRNWMNEASWPMAVCRLGAQLADGLAYAHGKGVLHRDIKPANVLLTPTGTPKLADFNVSYNGGRMDEDPADTFGGSLVYMSPEQLKACHPVLGGSPQLVRGPSDVYSLGVMLWELLCGRRPFDDDSDDEQTLARIQRMIDRRQYVDFNELAQQLPKDCPESLKQVLLRCLQSRQDERYTSAEEVARDLRLCLHPRVWSMMQFAENPLSKAILGMPLMAALTVSVLPNILILAFKFYYYRLWVAQQMPEYSEKFDKILFWVNIFAFAIGMGYGLYVAADVFRAVSKKDPDGSDEAGRRVLFFGRFVSLLTLILWTLAGIVYPIALGLNPADEGVLTLYTHFFLTLALCGFAAMTYPYFLLVLLAVRWFIPAMVRNHMILGPNWGDLQRLRFWNRVHVALSGLVPIFGVVLVTISGSEGIHTPLLVVSIGGGIGFAILFALERLIDNDIDALERIAVGAPATA